MNIVSMLELPAAESRAIASLDPPPTVRGAGQVVRGMLAIADDLAIDADALGIEASSDLIGACVWLRQRETELLHRHGAQWLEGLESGRHPLSRRALSVAPIWSAMIGMQEATAFARRLAAACVATQMIVHANPSMHPDATSAPRYQSAATRAGLVLRRLLGDTSMTQERDTPRCQIDHLVARLRVDSDNRALRDIAAFVTIAAPGRRIRNVLGAPGSPRSAQHEDRVYLGDMPGQSDSGTGSIARGVTPDQVRETDAHPEDLSVDVTHLMTGECDRSLDPYHERKRRKASARDMAARAAQPLSLAAREALPSPAALDRIARGALDDDRPADWIMLACLLTGRSLDTILEYFAGAAGENPEIAYDSIASAWDVLVPAVEYKRRITIAEQIRMEPVSSRLSLPDPLAVGKHCRRVVHASDNIEALKLAAERRALSLGIRVAALHRVLPAQVLAACDDPVQVAMITGRIAHAGHVQLHYAAIAAQALQATYVSAVRATWPDGLGQRYSIPGNAQPGRVGNPRCPRRDTVIEIVGDLRDRSRERWEPGRRGWKAAHNAYTAYTIMGLHLAVGMRAVTDPYPVDLAPNGLAVIRDKDDGTGYHVRYGAIPPSVMRQLEAYEHYRGRMWRYFVCGSAPSPYFVRLKAHFTAASFAPKDFAEIAGIAPGTLRRYFCSALYALGVSGADIHAAMGHWTPGREPWQVYSTMALEAWCDRMRRASERLVAEVGYGVIS